MTSARSTAAQDAAYQRLDKALDSVDASVFSGELLYIDTHRELLKTYIERWNKAIAEHELMALLESPDESTNKQEQGRGEAANKALASLSKTDKAQLVELVGELKGLCKDFSDRQNRPMMADVTAALDGLIHLMTNSSKTLFKEKEVVSFLHTLKQTCRALSELHTPVHLDLVNKALDKVSLEFGLSTDH